MKRTVLQLAAVFAVCAALLTTTITPAVAAAGAGWGWHTGVVDEVGITGPDNWFAVIKTDAGDKHWITFSTSYQKELLAIALTAKSTEMKVRAFYNKDKKSSSCKALYIKGEGTSHLETTTQ